MNLAPTQYEEALERIAELGAQLEDAKESEYGVLLRRALKVEAKLEAAKGHDQFSMFFENLRLRDQLEAMIDGLELEGDAINGTPEALKITCQIVALGAKKYDPMKAQLKAAHADITQLQEGIQADACLNAALIRESGLKAQLKQVRKLPSDWRKDPDWETLLERSERRKCANELQAILDKALKDDKS